jgi:hypothetical protein
MPSPKSQIEHKIIGLGSEVYVFHLKDKPDRQGAEIYNLDGKPMKLQKIRIVKFQGQNNRIKVELIKQL